ncbi:MAG: NAD-dependent epimerase/dehydratase family protein [Pseudomonadota bacterium]
MRFAVIGATGFVGRAIIRYRADTGHHALPLTRGKVEMPQPMMIGDLGDSAVTTGAHLIEPIDAMAHFAAMEGSTRTVDNAAFHSANVNATRHAAA